MLQSVYGKRFFVTGHTGFKGTWLVHLLHKLGGIVAGYSLPPVQCEQGAVFEVSSAERLCDVSIFGDIREMRSLSNALASFEPDIVIHMAAQPLVITAYDEPLETFSVNVMGTASLLNACRHVDSVRGIISITTDKVYENQEWAWPYRETDPVGGHDPYSASKACAEIVTSSMGRSFFSGAEIHTVRAGNVIGGGDWAENRLIPDIARAALSGTSQKLRVRSPKSTRPWQHVLDPLVGYLTLANEILAGSKLDLTSWNFGPQSGQHRTVEDMLKRCREVIPNLEWEISDAVHHEAGLLSLDSSNARAKLGWASLIDFNESIERSLRWYQHYLNGSQTASDLISDDINFYLGKLADECS